MKEVLFTQVNDLEMNTKEDIDVLMEIIAVSDFKDDYTKSNLTSSLNKVVYHDDNDKDFILYVIDRFSKVEDPEVREISLEYLYEYLAQEAARDEDLTEALTYGDLLFQLNPKNKIGIKVIEYVCFRKVGISALDLGALEDFEAQTEKYPFLKENNRYHLSLGVFYANLSISYIITKEMDKTATYMEKLEHLLDTTDVLEELNKGMLAELYIKAGNFYYYKEQYKTAYTIYKKGLSYIPDHAELNKRLGWAKEEL